MFLSKINFCGAASNAAEMRATAGSYNSQTALINNSRAQESLLKNADKMREKDIFERDKKLAMERAKEQTKLKLEEAQKKALEEKRRKEAAKK